jgi:hypothetical protein
MNKARNNLQKYIDQDAQENRTVSKSLSEWQDILTNRSREAVLDFLLSSAETAGRLKQSGPWSPYNSVSAETSLSIEKGGNRFVVLNNKS